ncbi:hypothetical protein PVK06_017025 [Gossypium arboreum]|uniref:Reverse transcriptase n=1 Tax=Gossypium arboreum TaxID=29729 RepID=A0ABR0Q2J3_GOSAR|nr:hypothetical protein PVK06_017025 [Gossypium arboreum]
MVDSSPPDGVLQAWRNFSLEISSWLRFQQSKRKSTTYLQGTQCAWRLYKCCALAYGDAVEAVIGSRRQFPTKIGTSPRRPIESVSLPHIWRSEVTCRGASILKGILKEYRSYSGQCVNFDKSTVFFSKNTTTEAKGEVVRILGVRSSNDPDRYLGLPNMVGRKKRESFQNLKDRIKKRIDNWSTRHLSQGGMKYLLRPFSKPSPLIQWLVFITEIVMLGIRKHHSYFLVAKKFEQKRNSLKCVKKSLNDNDVKLIADLIEDTSKTWKIDLINSTFPKDVAQKILRIPLAETPHEDFQVWKGEQSGEFSVRSPYKLLQDAQLDLKFYLIQTDLKDFYNKLWNLQLPAKIAITTWRISWNYIPSLVNLKYKRMTNNVTCPCCGKEEEDITHIFRNFKSTSGLIVWDRGGKLMVTKTVLHRNVLSPFAAEALAGLHALKLGSEMDLPSVTVMGDSRTIIKKCQAMKRDKSAIGAIINNIHNKITQFGDLRFQFINRTLLNMTPISSQI